MKLWSVVALAATVFGGQAFVHQAGGLVNLAAMAGQEVASTVSDTAQAAPLSGKTIEIGFSPEGTAARLVIKVIDSAKSTVRMAAYSFTSKEVAGALIAAKKRGVDVQVVADAKESSSAYGRAALSALANSGIAVRINARYAIFHDKFIVVDGKHTETGSFNYSSAAEKRNSENVLVVWDNPELASVYAGQWQQRFNEAQDFSLQY